MSKPEHIEVAVIGAGPAGLMAAETLVGLGYKPVLFDAMPTPARKFLMAGKSGLNLTHSEAYESFVGRYGEAAQKIQVALDKFAPSDVRAWADGLGAQTFEGSSGRIFPEVFKASPLLRSWLKRIIDGGAELRTRHLWQGFTPDGAHSFTTLSGAVCVTADATIFAMGGSSWPKLGGTGAWRQAFLDEGITVHPFRPTNCGFLVDWSPYFKDHFAGEPIKNVVVRAGTVSTKGDFIISENGIEGSAVYTVSAALRDMLDTSSTAALTVDLTPDRSLQQLTEALSRPRGKKSFSNHLKRATGLTGAKANLLRECAQADANTPPEQLAVLIKALKIPITDCRPIEEAISVAGGIAFEELDTSLMLVKKPGTFVCGEMVDWEAPTGGYLLTACFAQGKQAATGAATLLRNHTR